MDNEQERGKDANTINRLLQHASNTSISLKKMIKEVNEIGQSNEPSANQDGTVFNSMIHSLERRQDQPRQMVDKRLP